MKLVPLGDKILAKKKPAEVKETVGSIIIPEEFQEKKERPDESVVVAVGPGRHDEEGRLIPMTVQAGDTIFHSRYGWTEIKWEGEDYLLMTMDDVLAKVEA